ncbi:CPCC family cysteine-rich protein [Morganella morganii]|uniref:CPCC family cysteine-rich protein n=1 Tax=Morganella morganii TaxID=582 RepID=UPI0030D30395
MELNTGKTKMTIEDLYSCPCCGNKTISELGNYEICSICGWEDDPVQSSEPDFAGGANTLNLIESRKNFLLKNPSQ